MLKVPQQQYIRFLREHERCNVQAIAERVGVSWRTAKKYADRDDWNESVVRNKRRHPVLGPYLDVIDTWLTEDERMPRKQRHTARRIFHRLQDEFGFPGGERTVSEYVANRRKTMGAARKSGETFERLEHPGSEAQADFGTVHIVKAGQLVERKVLTVSFPYSNAAFVFPVYNENAECFLEALKRIFTQMGGVPRKIWFDNLSAAVVSVLRYGKRDCTEAFLRFCAHYRFEPEFCNPASGNEKGNVENKVGYGRRNWCVPPPVVDTPEQFEDYLVEAARTDMQRMHYAKQERISDLWEQERGRLLALPTVPLDIFRLETRKLNKYSELAFDDTLLPLPQCRALQPVMLKVRWDELEVLTADGNYTLIATLPRPYTEKSISLDWVAIFGNYVRKPRTLRYSTFAKMMPEPLQAFLDGLEPTVLKSRLALIHRLLAIYTVVEVGDGLAELSDSEHAETALEHTLYARRHSEFHPEPFHEPHTPASIQGHLPTLDTYDQALGVRM